MNEEAIEIRLKSIEKAIEELKEMIEKTTTREYDRIEKYADSNARLTNLEAEFKEYKEKQSKSAGNVLGYITSGITIILFIITLITLVGVKKEETSNARQIQESKVYSVCYNTSLPSYGFLSTETNRSCVFDSRFVSNL